MSIETTIKSMTGSGEAKRRPVLTNGHIKLDRVYFTDLQAGLELPLSSLGLANPHYRDGLVSAGSILAASANGGGIIDGDKLGGLTVAFMPSDSFPDVPTIPQEELTGEATISGAQLKAILKDASWYSSPAADRYALDCVRLDWASGCAIATDQVMLRAVRIPLNQTLPSMDVPVKAIKHILGLLATGKNSSETITIRSSKSSVEFTSDHGAGWRYITRQNDVQMPNYLQAIENYTGGMDQVDHTALLAAANSLASLACKDHLAIKCQFTDCTTSKLNISMSTPKGSLTLDVDFPSTTYMTEWATPFGVNVEILQHYLKDVVSRKHPREKVSISLTGHRKPIVFGDSAGFLFVSPIAI